MKKIIIPLLVLMLNYAHAQLPHFAPVGATWNYSLSDMRGDQTRTYLVEKDTVFLSDSCKKLTNSIFLKYITTTAIVYYAEPTSQKWMQLIDFSANAGDTIYTVVTGRDQPFDTLYAIVRRKADTLLNGHQLPLLVTQAIRSDIKKCANTFDGTFIYPIGSIDNTLIPLCVTDPVPNGLLCYEDGTLGLVENRKNCTTTYVSNNVNKKNIPIYHNPATNGIVLDIEKAFTYTIYSSVGQLVLQGAAQAQEPISVVALPKGFYVVHIQAGEQVGVAKLLKE